MDLALNNGKILLAGKIFEPLASFGSIKTCRRIYSMVFGKSKKNYWGSNI